MAVKSCKFCACSSGFLLQMQIINASNFIFTLTFRNGLWKKCAWLHVICEVEHLVNCFISHAATSYLQHAWVSWQSRGGGGNCPPILACLKISFLSEDFLPKVQNSGLKIPHSEAFTGKNELSSTRSLICQKNATSCPQFSNPRRCCLSCRRCESFARFAAMNIRQSLCFARSWRWECTRPETRGWVTVERSR